MSILAECPICKKRQSLKNKLCKCGENLDKAKRSRKVKYHIKYRLPGGKQRQEMVGFSISEARDADSKRRVQKRENRIFEILPESNVKFQELSEWYLSLKSVKKLASFLRIKIAFRNFNKVLGDRIISTIRPIELEDFQEDREKQGLAPATIDLEMRIVKAMINKAFDNDMLSGRVLKAFRKVKPKLKKGSNARKRMLSFKEYLRLIDTASQPIKGMIIMAYYTGMRSGELVSLQRSHIDRETMFIRLPAELTKEDKPKSIPINQHVKNVIDSSLRAIQHDFVFTIKGAPIRYLQIVQKMFRTACKHSKITYGRKIPNGITFHDIRRTVKTNMLSAGIDKVHRDLILGHSLKGMDIHYLVPSEDSLMQAIDKYTWWIDNQIANVDLTVDYSNISV
jgi:integrase